ncbi:hypothetical protein [Streptomyces lydicus]|uniref:hypothetical protein n=1 Tax=Streptomyces lydicus TaxID=47763 RepID=UPI0036EB48AA
MTTLAADPNARFLAAQFGQRIADLLNSPGKRALAVEAFDLVASSYWRKGDDVARNWMIGMCPPLGDRSPLDAIAAGDGDDVLAAARSEARGDHAN